MTTLSAKQTSRAIDLKSWIGNKPARSQSRSNIFMPIRLSALKERLGFFRDYPSFQLTAVITLMAVLLFITTCFLSKNLKAQLQTQSISLAQQVKSLSASAISTDRLEAEHERLRALEADADEIGLLALQSTQRELLSYDVFAEPDPNMSFSTSVYYVFGQQFRSGIDQLIAHVNGRDCPTEVEVDRSLEESLSLSGRRGFTHTGLSRGSTQSRYGRYMSRIERVIVDEICKERA